MPSASSLAEIEALCRAIPGLTRERELLWSRGRGPELSYPEEGLAILAAIEDKSYWFRHRNEVLAAAIRRHPPGGVLFDIGGGNGVVGARLARDGIAAVVIEPDEAGAARAAARGLPAIQAAFQDLDLAAASIPAAGLFDVLEHIEDDTGTLARLNRVLKPGGMLYIAVPSLGWLWSHQDVVAGHFRRYTTQNLSAKLTAAGFTPLLATYFFAALVPAVLLFRSLPSYLGLKTDDQERQAHADHSLPAGPIGTMLAASFARELRRIEGGWPVGIGTSCLVVARKA
jgi:SAM-dependent methyltransferase